VSDEVAKPKSWVQEFVTRAQGHAAVGPSERTLQAYAREAGSTLGEYATSGLLGLLLGAAHAKVGLDKAGVPIDGVLAAAGAIGAVALSGHYPRAAACARAGGSFALGFLAARKSYSFFGGGQGQLQQGESNGVSLLSDSPPVRRISAPVRTKSATASTAEDRILKAAASLGD